MGWGEKIVLWIQETLEKFWAFIEERFAEYADFVFQHVQDAIDSGVIPDFSPIAPYVSAANAWLPLDYIGILITAWLTFQGTVIGVRWVLKFIPTIG